VKEGIPSCLINSSPSLEGGSQREGDFTLTLPHPNPLHQGERGLPSWERNFSIRSFASLRMTGSKEVRMTGSEGVRMTTPLSL